MRSELEAWLGLNPDPFEDQFERVTDIKASNQVWRVTSRCHECNQTWVWWLYGSMADRTGYDRCAECAAREWNAENARRATIMNGATRGRLDH